MKNKDIKIILSIGFGTTAVLSLVCLFLNKYSALLCLALGTIMTVTYAVITKKRYDKLNELNNYMSLVCAGNFDLDIPDNTEGELSILKNNLYKVIVLLRTQNEALKKDKVYLADSLADISHQLKTPLTSIMVMTDLLKDDVDTAKKKEFVGVIENQSDKMRWLITNLLKLSKLDAGTAEFKQEKVSLKSVLEKSLEPFLITLDLRGITLETDINDFSIIGDENWSVEAFENIIKNCIEHTPDKGHLTVKTASTTVYDAVIIKDDGCGISKEDLLHIFERFYHGKNSSSDSVGIGLALSKTIFEREKGRVTVESRECIGSEFTVKFYKSII